VSLPLLLGAWAGPLEKKGFQALVLSPGQPISSGSWLTPNTSTRNPAYPLDVVDKLEEATMPKVQAWMAKRAGKTNNCTLENAAVRREWCVRLHPPSPLSPPEPIS